MPGSRSSGEARGRRRRCGRSRPARPRAAARPARPPPGCRPPVSRTWVESEALTRKIFALGRDGPARSRSRPRARAHRRGRRPRRRRRAGRRGAGREDESGDEIVGAAELEAVGAPDGDVGALARLERADVVAPQHRGAAARAESDRLARRHRGSPPAAARDEQRLLDLEEQVAALVRRRAVDAEADADARVEEVAHRRDAGAEPQVRGRAVRDAGAGRRELRDLRGGQVDAVRAPDVVWRASRAARGTRPACSRTARGSTPPPRPSRRGGCAAAGRAGGRARPTPPSGGR